MEENPRDLYDDDDPSKVVKNKVIFLLPFFMHLKMMNSETQFKRYPTHSLFYSILSY